MGITTKISQQLEGNSLLRPNHTKQFARQKPPPPQGPRTNQEMRVSRLWKSNQAPLEHNFQTWPSTQHHLLRGQEPQGTRQLNWASPSSRGCTPKHRSCSSCPCFGWTDLSRSYDLLHTSVFMCFMHFFFTPTHTYQKNSNIYSQCKEIFNFLEQIWNISCQYLNGCANVPSVPGLPLEKPELYKLSFPDTPSYITVSSSPRNFCPTYAWALLTTFLSTDAFLLQHIMSINVFYFFFFFQT